MDASEEDSEYLRHYGVHVTLENLITDLVRAKPHDPLSFMVEHLQTHHQTPSVKDRLTVEDIERKLALIHSMFIGKPVRMLDGISYAAFTLTDFVPPMDAFILEDMADCLVFLADFFEKADVIVSIAARGAGPLAHAISVRAGIPYSLCNWYPEGSIGDLLVEPSAGFSGAGNIFLNSIRKGHRVVLIDDIIRTGHTARSIIRAVQSIGAVVLGCCFVGEASNLNGRGIIRKECPNVKICTLVKFFSTGSHTVEDAAASPRFKSSQIVQAPRAKLFRLPKTEAELQVKLDRIARTFVGITITPNPGSKYPYSCFCLTDFVPLMEPSLVEDMADCCVKMADFQEVDIIVSESDRGGGPLTHACALRALKPYCLANWYSSGTDISAGTKAYVGYSGEGSIFVNGVKPGERVIVVDDMLSSGGTAIALFKCIEKAGGIVVSAVFASEKVSQKGRDRIWKDYPNVKLTSLCYFNAEGSQTTMGDPSEQIAPAFRKK